MLTPVVTCTSSQELDSAQFSARRSTSLKRWYALSRSVFPNKTLTGQQIYTSAVALSTAINTNEINAGRLYPELDRIREVSVTVAREVIREAQRQGLDREKSIRNLSDSELDAFIRSRMYDPTKETGLEGNEAQRFRALNARPRIPSPPSKL
jgi:malate dehydrogenase (oxaloacetate-decarboxylating)(NADP+)